MLNVRNHYVIQINVLKLFYVPVLTLSINLLICSMNSREKNNCRGEYALLVNLSFFTSVGS